MLHILDSVPTRCGRRCEVGQQRQLQSKDPDRWTHSNPQQCGSTRCSERPLSIVNHHLCYLDEQYGIVLAGPWPSKSCTLDTYCSGMFLYQPDRSPKNHFCLLRSSVSRCHGLDRRCKYDRFHQSQWQNHNHGCLPPQLYQMTKQFQCMRQGEVHSRIDPLHRQHRRCGDGCSSQLRYRSVQSEPSLRRQYPSMMFHRSSCKRGFHPIECRSCKPSVCGHYYQ